MSQHLIPVLALFGCGVHVEGETPLSDEHRVAMQTIVDDLPSATAMSVRIAARMDKGLMNAYGEPANTDELQQELQETTAWVQTAFAEGRILEVDPTHFPTDDTIAMYDREASAHQSDDRIVVSDRIEDWSLQTVVHEAGHRSFDHALFTTQEIRDAGAGYNAAFADIIIRHGDYSYLLTALYHIPAELIANNRKTVEDAQATAEGDPAVLRETLAMPSEADMETHIRATYASEAAMFEEFGVSMDDIIRAYRESGMHERLAEMRKEAIAECQRERTRELRTERRLH